MTHRLGIILFGDQLAVLVAQQNCSAVAIELERCLIPQDIAGTEPDDLESPGRHRAHVAGHLPHGRVIGIVA